MRVPEFGQIRRAARWLRSGVGSRTIILVYHRVAELPSDPQLLSVTPQHFAEQLSVLKAYARPARLGQLVRTHRGNATPGDVVITFDDGYADNLYNAKPLLERYEIPATVFVVAGQIGQRREFWWDELDRLLLHGGTLPEALHLSVSGKTYEWDLGEPGHRDQRDVGINPFWNVLENHASHRQQVYRSLCELLRPLADDQRQGVLEDLRIRVGVEPTGRDAYRALFAQELRSLAADGLVEVGAHTMTHPALSKFPLALQQTEIRQSKACLEEILGRPVASFAYPYGSPSDYMRETTAIVRDAGFTCACANFAGVVRQGTDRFQLPRFLVRDWDGDTFARRLRQWLCG